jgi:hypothetical protein
VEKYQPPGFDFLFSGLKRLADVDWKLVELEDDEQPAGSEVVAVGVEQLGPAEEPRPVTQDI